MTSDAIASYDPAWPGMFDELGQRLRRALGPMADRIDHIGSTAVPGLAAKPVIDVQVSVPDLSAVEEYGPAIESCGFQWRRDNPDLAKRYFRELPGARRTHVHVRRTGSFDEQAALLFRDHLRANPEQAARYEAVKREHAHLLDHDRAAYVEAKAPMVWELL